MIYLHSKKIEVLLLIILMSFLHVNGERKLPYKIKGPKSFDDKIAIVGAGPSGIHMAYLLKQKGFNNIHILERSSRIGGKAYTVYHRNTALDVGALLIRSNSHIHKLAKKFLPAEILRKPNGDTVWLDGKKLTYEEYFVHYAKNVLGGIYESMENKAIRVELSKALIRYFELRDHIFGNFEGAILPMPKNPALTNGSLHDFLIRNNLQLLIPVFYGYFEQFGYGYMHQISAIYGLIYFDRFWITGAGGLSLKCGYQKLWQVIADKERLRIRYNVDIQKVRREYEEDRREVLLLISQNKKPAEWEHFDFLIWSPDMQSSIARWVNQTPLEKELLTGTSSAFYMISIVDSSNEQHGFSPYNLYPNNMKRENEGKVEIMVDKYSFNHNYTGKKYLSSQYPTGDDNKQATTYITFQMTLKKKSKSELTQILWKHFQKLSASSIKVVFSKTWDYFPRYSIADIEKGVIWKIIEMQGKYGMWYIGSSVYFESVHFVVSYNTFLVENMENVV